MAKTTSSSMMPMTSKPVASPVSSITLPAAPLGMNVSQAANEIQDTEAVYLQDILLDIPGFARRRGPVTPVSGAAALPRPAMGLAMTVDPKGVNKFGVLTGDGASGHFTLYSPSLSSNLDVAWPIALGTSPYPIVDQGAALNVGTMIATSSDYGADTPSQAIAYWGGGTNANYTAGTITVARGSTAVTGSGTTWGSSISAGMWLFANTDDGYTNAFIGLVQSVTDDTHLVLASPSPYPATAKTYTAQALRGVYPKVMVGAITAGSGSTTLSGGGTKFLKQGLNTGSWNIYRASDMAWVGKVASVQSDTSLTLAAGAAISTADDAYVALRADGDYAVNLTSSKPGFLTATYAGRQWYANNGSSNLTPYRLWFSDPTDPEGLDMSLDGDWIPINSSGDTQEPIMAIATAQNALIVIKQTETFGVFGTDPSTFQVLKLEDDGVLNGMSVQQYGGGVIWTGRKAIYYYDGTTVNNLTDSKFGTVWATAMETFNPITHRMWSMIERNHYFVHIESLSPPLAVVKGNVSTTPDHWVVALNLTTNAPSIWTNAKFRGSITLPATQNYESWFVYNDGTKGVLAQALPFFTTEGLDPAVEGVTGAGPDFYFQSKRIDGGSPTRQKRFTYFILNYLIQGGFLNIDTVLGLNNLGVTSTTTFPASVLVWATIAQSIDTWAGLKDQFATWSDIVDSVFVPDRLRFLKKSQFMAFRLWEQDSTIYGDNGYGTGTYGGDDVQIERMQIGDFELGYKFLRPGRI